MISLNRLYTLKYVLSATNFTRYTGMFTAPQQTYNWAGAGVTNRGFYTGSGSEERTPGGSQQQELPRRLAR